MSMPGSIHESKTEAREEVVEATPKASAGNEAENEETVKAATPEENEEKAE